MALIQTQICNMALSQLGVDKQIIWGDGSKEAKICQLWYDVVRQEMLTEYPWDFAKVTVALSQTANTPPMNWIYQFAIPSDCLRMLRILVPHTDHPRSHERIPYESAAAANPDGSFSKVLNCNFPSPLLEYVQDVQDLSRWWPNALTAFSLSLGAKIGMSLTVLPELVKAIADAAKQAVLEAAADSMSQGNEGPEPESEFIAVRHIGWHNHHAALFPWTAYPSGNQVL